MTRSTAVSVISCPTCGAGLDVLGGGRVITHICGYCGTELDALDSYRALRRFADLPRPGSLFGIGMTGRVAGVEYTVIGTLGVSDGASWAEHLLFSPTHGYAWLSVEDGHLIWTRRYRKAVAWMSVTQVETSEHPPEVRSEGETYRYYETSHSRISHAEGEFTWRPAIGDRAVTVSALSDRHMLHFTETGAEREVERSAYLPQAETLAAFGLEPLRRVGVHPLQPHVAGPHDGFLTRMALGFAAVSAVLSLVFLSLSGTPVLRPVTLTTAQLPAELPVEIDRPGKLAHVVMLGEPHDLLRDLRRRGGIPRGAAGLCQGDVGAVRGEEA